MPWIPIVAGVAVVIGIVLAVRSASADEGEESGPLDVKPGGIELDPDFTPGVDEPTKLPVPGFYPFEPPVIKPPGTPQFGPEWPSDTPIQGRFYVIKYGDTLSRLAAIAYGDGTKWRTIRDHPTNAWIPKHAIAGLDLVPKYGPPQYLVPKGSGSRFPKVFIPVMLGGQNAAS